MLAVHDILARALVALAVILGLWGGFEFLSRRALSGGFRSTYLILALVTALQGLAGLVLLLTGARPHELLHVVYGVFAVLFLPGVYVWAGGRRSDTEAAILAVACWVVVIAYLRGFGTG